jgi:hypothetical protein
VPPTSAAWLPVCNVPQRAHERQVNMHVRINEARKNKFALRVDDFRTFWHRDIFIDARDGFVSQKMSAM